MTAHSLTDCIMAAIIAAAMSTAYLLDAPGATPGLIYTSPSAADAQQQARQQARFERAARKACGGSEGAYELLDDGSIQCFTYRGTKTVLAKVAL